MRRPPLLTAFGETQRKRRSRILTSSGRLGCWSELCRGPEMLRFFKNYTPPPHPHRALLHPGAVYSLRTLHVRPSCPPILCGEKLFNVILKTMLSGLYSATPRAGWKRVAGLPGASPGGGWRVEGCELLHPAQAGSVTVPSSHR